MFANRPSFNFPSWRFVEIAKREIYGHRRLKGMKKISAELHGAMKDIGDSDDESSVTSLSSTAKLENGQKEGDGKKKILF